MAKKKVPVTPVTIEGKYGDTVEGVMANMVVNSEYLTAAANNNTEYADFESLIDKIDGIRSEKNYSWNSDIVLGVFLAHLLTDASTWATQYFSSRDFCNVYLEGDQPDDKLKSAAVKKLINKTLNMQSVYHFQKYMRARIVNWLFGQVYLLCYWENKTKTKSVEQAPLVHNVPEWDETTQQVIGKQIAIPQPNKDVENIIYDRFNYEVLDPRNVFTDYGYCYSIQQKPWVSIRSETTYEDLKRDKDRLAYFNLDKVKESVVAKFGDTKTATETYNKDGDKSPFSNTPQNKFDLLQRFGKMWAIVEDSDDYGIPTKIKPGMDQNGQKLEDAELVESITTFAMIRGINILIRFQPTPYINSQGEPYKPVIRGWCYIHPTKDFGLSDGKNLREIDTGINDTFNISNDRVMLATLPTLKIRKGALEDNPTVYFEPNHLIELENPKEDLMEIEIRDNVGPALEQIGMLKGMASELDSIYPTTMGGLPEDASTTATAIAGAESRSNARGGFKSLTWEYTAQCELYTMIIQMTHRFCNVKTAIKLLGDLAYQFDPDGDYTYVPLSQALEQEHTKVKKIGQYDQMIGRLAGLAKVSPQGIIPIIAWAIGKQAVELGSEYQEINVLLQNLIKAPVTPEGQGATQTADGAPPQTSNQAGIESSPAEMGARDMGNAAGGGMLQ